MGVAHIIAKPQMKMSPKRCGVSSIVRTRDLLALRSPTFRHRIFIKESVSFECKRGRRRCPSILVEGGPETADSSAGMMLQEEPNVSVVKDSMDSGTSFLPEPGLGGDGGDSLGGSGGNGKFPSGGGGGGGDHEENGEEEELGPLLKFEEVMREAGAQGASLPSDMLEAAKTIGIRQVLLLRYLDLQGSAWPLRFAIKYCSMLRTRMLADPAFLFKVGTEIVIDSGRATFAEIQKRGKDFWAEFELYFADLLVGVVVNVALVGLLAPYARIGQPSLSNGLFGCMQRAYGALPSSIFEAERPGCSFSIQQRVGTYCYKLHNK
ncbi:protein RETICULATA, chloroplastic [Cinnamomum micranthum f. kanehirae]|uniref:Protein RETICULATA, chloroplastic n=1 Tax=Cinnamomum micranthum f. kanehirae TaxID=337451 RepID=A0A443P5V4_9MAGN|nr:protein RETICULATA, chloroplastic [Cinnamomum micranthum f. kanehirae]